MDGRRTIGVLALCARWGAWAAVVLGTSFLAAFGTGIVVYFLIAHDEEPAGKAIWWTFAALVLLQVCASWLLRNRKVPWILGGAVTVVALTVTGALVCVPLAFWGLRPLTQIAQSRATREWLLVAACCMPVLGALVGAGLGAWLTRRQRRTRGRGRAEDGVGPAPSPVSSPK